MLQITFFERRSNGVKKMCQQRHLALKPAGSIPKKYFRNLVNNLPCDAVFIGHKKAVTRAQLVVFAR